ncbi:MAG: general secretion pathway protein GspB [Thiogranum sp.]
MDRKLIGALLLLGPGLAGSVHALKDPTQPTDPGSYFGSAESRAGNSWSLQSILSSPQRRIAVINGTRVKEGDRIGSARVVRIHDSHVLLNTSGRTLTLHLFPESIKVRP